MALVTSDERRVVVIVGNPQPGSRTATVAAQLGERLAALVGIPSVELVELADLAAGLFDWHDEAVARAKQRVLGAEVVVVASPTYKAAYTGMLKAFLDRFERGELAPVRAVVPLMTGAGPAHALAVEVHLRPVLVEIGASCPTRGLYVSGEEIDDPAAVLDRWLAESADALTRAGGPDGGDP